MPPMRLCQDPLKTEVQALMQVCVARPKPRQFPQLSNISQHQHHPAWSSRLSGVTHASRLQVLDTHSSSSCAIPSKLILDLLPIVSVPHLQLLHDQVLRFNANSKAKMQPRPQNPKVLAARAQLDFSTSTIKWLSSAHSLGSLRANQLWRLLAAFCGVFFSVWINILLNHTQFRIGSHTASHGPKALEYVFAFFGSRLFPRHRGG
ncbi:hypothetical protein B0H14DRAFT_1331547 [Mycena olivaceomarginata]|nr:hypothetical protein B0H14DRAFT_1331547 [Mycena olivaceomarginata]